ncbi:DUF1801 domain-containing protein [Roseateles sp. YR242]|uniref:DUF1801 domain-containing protein n=1 Tax=Roseateles sp. YR242 TaxID=1855305 RepID=UPI0011600C1F|nr:DUF1801 domain-containing protein [Roseateles sp. YR242]
MHFASSLSDAEGCVISSASPPLQSVALALRKALLDVHPNATVLAWPAHKIISFGFGPKKMSEHYAFIALHAGHVNLGLYHGASLQVDELEVEGTGKSMRHVKVGSVAEAESPAIRRVVQIAREFQAMRLADRAGGATHELHVAEKGATRTLGEVSPSLRGTSGPPDSGVEKRSPRLKG